MQVVLLENILPGFSIAIQHVGSDIHKGEPLVLGAFCSNETVRFRHFWPQVPASDTGFYRQKIDAAFWKFRVHPLDELLERVSDRRWGNALSNVIVTLINNDCTRLIRQHNSVGIMQRLVHVASAKATWNDGQ